jgi:arsenate reductase
MAHYFNVPHVYCYSGGTEATAMFYKVAETLTEQGFQINKKDESTNPIYEVKFDEQESPIICFSKTFDDPYNPETNFAAIMTCSTADEACPYIAGATKRIPIRYEDPKAFDNTPEMEAKYKERSLEIAREMMFVFSNCRTVEV